MKLYERKFGLKVFIVIFGLLITVASLVYNSYLASSLAEEETTKMKIFTDAYNELNSAIREVPPNCRPYTMGWFPFVQRLTQYNNTIPLLVTDTLDKISYSRNFPENRSLKTDSIYFDGRLQAMKDLYDPITISYRFKNTTTGEWNTLAQRVYYDESSMLKQLRWYPYVQLGVIACFFAVSYVAFSAARRSEQNMVWLGMAKETAHQLGTPLSSMVGWVELLKASDDESGEAQMVGAELEKDVNRLKLIADRFSKIGSEPKLERTNINETLWSTVRYVKRRASSKINFDIDIPNEVVEAQVNPILFDWVIENLLKNALDAMDGKGEIEVQLIDAGNDIHIEVSDTGKGIPRSKFSTVFQPGFSTKQRGWGLGLSLSKRIMENYHKGKIYVLSSTVGKGTTFRVELPKQSQSETIVS